MIVSSAMLKMTVTRVTANQWARGDYCDSIVEYIIYLDGRTDEHYAVIVIVEYAIYLDGRRTSTMLAILS